ncbi:hypothetical protein EV385_3310 [Krasilnikovia cinnamomea]|uniref:Uncharacterized protein n=1 Tax=Krasilnikovia cinnamomea TaxID=349313 RepID=A0A4Q7ZLK0_9ACTN|nr:hypothetical protein [Krasilnikovia cinnamomea]RZU51481.1 hypothetical protein EV385_3310 [Krasilnikovia cinnamomea]
MTTPDFVERFRQASAAATGRRAYLPGEMLSRWEQVVDFVVEGYDDCLDEYFFDLGVRGSLDAVLRDPELQQYPELTWVREKLAEIDDRFRACLRDEPIPRLLDYPWWESHPPRYAGPQLAADYLTTYGVTVEIREN